MASLRQVPESSWAQLATRRVFFGHQSVGGNIMDGVADILREQPNLGLRVVAGDSASDGGAAFAHATVGKNGEPGGKTDDFAARLEGGLGQRVDIALHKYCYVDLTESTDVPAVFEHYKSTMARLHAEYPGVTFVHVTAPVVVVPSDPRAFIKRLLGKMPARVGANLARQQFNELLRREYAGREPVFDLAAVESTRPDGTREAIEFGKRSGFALVPGYSSDGSHLNETGRRRAAEALLVLLAGLPATPASSTSTPAQ